MSETTAPKGRRGRGAGKPEAEAPVLSVEELYELELAEAARLASGDSTGRPIRTSTASCVDVTCAQ